VARMVEPLSIYPDKRRVVSDVAAIHSVMLMALWVASLIFGMGNGSPR